jgi:two-component system sensor histidine kinase BaeS
MSALKQITIDFVSDLESCSALIDRVEFARVITKLMENAITYTPQAGHITVETHIDKNWLTISMQDSGVGILAEDLPHIFERFYRADRARSTETGGSGLGLSIVQKIVEAHNGRIDVESTPGRGSKFSIRLPITK